MQDWNYINTGDFEITLEISDIKYPAENTLASYYPLNRPAMIAYMQQVHTGIKGFVTDPNGVPLSAAITLSANNKVIYTDPQNGDYYRLIVPGQYTVTFSASGFQNQTVSVSVTNGMATVQNVTLTSAASKLLLSYSMIIFVVFVAIVIR